MEQEMRDGHLRATELGLLRLSPFSNETVTAHNKGNGVEE